MYYFSDIGMVHMANAVKLGQCFCVIQNTVLLQAS